MSTVSPIVVPEATGPMSPDPAARGERALKDFESLFIETLLQSSGMLKSLDTEGGPEGGLASELMVRELATKLAGQLRLDFGRQLGIGMLEKIR
jgi:hypothetical protein